MKLKNFEPITYKSATGNSWEFPISALAPVTPGSWADSKSSLGLQIALGSASPVADQLKQLAECCTAGAKLCSRRHFERLFVINTFAGGSS